MLVAGFDRPNIYLRVERVDGERRQGRTAAGAGARAPRARAMRRRGRPPKPRRRVCRRSASRRPRITRASRTTSARASRTRLPPGRCPWCARPTRSAWASTVRTSTRVVHYAIPGSVEAYYQEIGRAGRDGRPATATLLWDYADVATRQFLIDSPRRDKPGQPAAALDPAEVARRKELEHTKLQRMIDYADTRTCLRATILRYFGDPAVREPCGSCGNCRPGAIDAYERELVRKILVGHRARRRAVRPAPHRRHVARRHRRRCRRRWRGSRRPDCSVTRLSDALHGWIDASISAGLVVVSKDQYRTLSLTRTGPGDHARADADLQIRPAVEITGLSSLRRYRGDLPQELRARRRFADLGPERPSRYRLNRIQSPGANSTDPTTNPGRHSD